MAASMIGGFHGGTAVDARPSAPFDRVVTMGDSYSSGQGIHADASDYDDHGPVAHSFSGQTRLGGSTCHRETDTTPGAQLAAKFGVTSTFVACAGAVVEDLGRQLSAAAIPGTGARTLIHLTIAGNDVRTESGADWPTALIGCITSRRCDEDARNQLADLSQMRRAVTSELVAVAREVPDATIRVLGYPRLMQRERWGCPGVTGVGRQEADWIDDRVDELNGAIDVAVNVARWTTGADVEFVDVVDEFDNHGSCRFWQRDRHVNDAVFGETYSRQRAENGAIVDRFTDSVLTISGSSFHPSQAGYDAYGEALSSSL
jgi:lysophospholipase L1-like esterase